VDQGAGGREHKIEQLVEWIRARGLAAPAILLLEMGKPLAPIGSQALLVLQPVFGAGLEEWATILEDPAAIEQILDGLEHTA
jgi:hypothetical protein